MTTDRQLDDRISRWLEAEAPTQLPDRVLRATFERTRKTRQQGGWLALLGRMHVNRFVFALGGVAAVVVVAALALGIYTNNPGTGVGGPGATPTTPPAASPTADGAAPTAPAATPKPSVAQATGTPRPVGLPEGPFAVTQLVAGAPTVTVTIPASGWRSLPEFEAIEKGTEVANVPEAAILFWAFSAGTDFYVPEDPCQAESTRPDEPATSVDEIVAALAAQASRNASEPENVTVGGYEGKSITLHVPDDAVFSDDAGNPNFEECELNEFVSYGINEEPVNRNHQGPGQIDELWILNVDGAIFIINGMYRPDTPAELVEEMRTVAESATFETP